MFSGEDTASMWRKIQEIGLGNYVPRHVFREQKICKTSFVYQKALMLAFKPYFSVHNNHLEFLHAHKNSI